MRMPKSRPSQTTYPHSQSNDSPLYESYLVHPESKVPNNIKAPSVAKAEGREKIMSAAFSGRKIQRSLIVRAGERSKGYKRCGWAASKKAACWVRPRGAQLGKGCPRFQGQAQGVGACELVKKEGR